MYIYIYINMYTYMCCSLVSMWIAHRYLNIYMYIYTYIYIYISCKITPYPFTPPFMIPRW